MNIVTVIPASGGSKSVPKKNIRPLHGKPLLQYSVEYSHLCSLVSHTVVSTDSTEIAAIAQTCGAEVPFLRPSDLAQDDTPDFPVFRHALEALELEWGEQIDALVLLRPTSPLRPKGLIERGVKLLKQFPAATSVRSVARAQEHPYRQWQIEEDFIVGFVSSPHEPYNIPRQKLPEVYFQTGDLEIVRRETLLSGSISGDKVLPLIIQPEEMVDIDHEADLREAERRLTERHA